VKVLATALLSAAIPLSLAGQSTISLKSLLSENALPRYTRSQIRQMIRGAHTADDFERLADYFDREAMEYEAKSQSEEQELVRLLVLPFHARSYAAQVESTRNRVDRFKALSRQCWEQAAMYRDRAKTAERANPVTTSPTC
jgi:hypothetical protein